MPPETAPMRSATGSRSPAPFPTLRHGSSTTSRWASPVPAFCSTMLSTPTRIAKRNLPSRPAAKMPARTGAEYLAALSQLKREIWFCGARVDDVVEHPAFAGAARTLASLYDLQHDALLRDEMLYLSPTSGEP